MTMLRKAFVAAAVVALGSGPPVASSAFAHGAHHGGGHDGRFHDGGGHRYFHFGRSSFIDYQAVYVCPPGYRLIDDGRCKRESF